jgi:hypothetical protein
MARTVLDSQLDSRTACARLQTRVKPYFRAIDPGLHLAYRRNTTGGTWNVRLYLGDGKYQMALLGTADDLGDADGTTVLNFSQAKPQRAPVTRRRRVLPMGCPSPTLGRTVSTERSMIFLRGWRARAAGKRTLPTGAPRPRRTFGPSLATSASTGSLPSKLAIGCTGSPRRRRACAARPASRRVIAMSIWPIPRRARRSAVNRVFGILKAALNRVWHDHKVASDQAWRRVKPFKGVTASRVRYLQLDECRRLLNAANDGDHFRDIVEAGLHSGARWSELCRLKRICASTLRAGPVGWGRTLSARPSLLLEGAVPARADRRGDRHTHRSLCDGAA